MRFKGTTAFLSQVGRLRVTTGHEFQRSAHQLLQQVWPDTRYARDLVGRETWSASSIVRVLISTGEPILNSIW
jgi:hypothetical protein